MKNTKTFYGTEEAKTDLIMSLYSHLYNMVETLCHGLRAGRQERTQCRLVRGGETSSQKAALLLDNRKT